MTSGSHLQTTDGSCFPAERTETCTRSDDKSGAALGKNLYPQGPLRDLPPKAHHAQLNKLPSCLIFEKQVILLAGTNLTF